MAEHILNWGFLSTARINEALIPPLHASKRNRLLAVASRSASTADAYARKWNIPRAFGSYNELLNDPEIDVIYNPLPNHLHAEWTVKALRAGKHVLCEKPLALSLAEVDAIAAAARETGKIAAEAFMYRHHPQTLKVKEIVSSGRLGSLRLIRGAFSFTLTREDDIRLRKETGGGSIWDVGCYPISYARYLAGDNPQKVYGEQILGPGGVDEVFFGQMHFSDDIHAQFDSGFKLPSRQFMEVVGTEGSLNIPLPFKPNLKEELYLTRNGRTETIKIRGQELYIGEVEDMADAILVAGTPRVSLADSRGNTAAILALIESARTGKPVSL